MKCSGGTLILLGTLLILGAGIVTLRIANEIKRIQQKKGHKT